MLVRLRFRFSEVFFGMLLAAAIFALGSAFWSQTSQNGKFAQQPSTAAATNGGQQNKQEIRWWQDPIAIFTLGLVLVGAAQVLLFYVQLRFIRKSLIEAKVSADAAKDAADTAKEQARLGRSEFIMANRPRLIVRDVYIDEGKIWFRLINTGSTKATIVESWAITEQPQGSLRSLSAIGHDQFGRLILASGEPIDLPYDPPPDHAFILKIGQRPNIVAPLYFTGTIVYVDEIGTRRISVFRRQWHNGKHSFIRLSAEEERDNEYAD